MVVEERVRVEAGKVLDREKPPLAEVAEVTEVGGGRERGGTAALAVVEGELASFEPSFKPLPSTSPVPVPVLDCSTEAVCDVEVTAEVMDWLEVTMLGSWKVTVLDTN